MPRPQRRKLARAVRNTNKPRSIVTKKNCLIDHVAPTGATTDGNPGVFIQVGSDVVQSAYSDHLITATPALAAGQTVAVLFVDGSPYILGRPSGLPSF